MNLLMVLLTAIVNKFALHKGNIIFVQQIKNKIFSLRAIYTSNA